MPLWDGYNAFYGRVGGAALSDEVTKMTWSRLIDPDVPMQAIVAMNGGRMLGIAHYLFHRSTTSIARNIYLQDLFTMEEARGRGIARALIGRVYEEARAVGTPRVYWHTHETNEHAINLYDRVAERSGFIVYRKLL